VSRTTLTTRQQGDLGEASAIEWLVWLGAQVFVPIGHSPDCDVVAILGGEALRIQVKTSRHLTPAGRYQVMLETRGGNQSWTGVAKRFDRTRYERLFVLVADGRRWFIPSEAIEAGTAICLGGPKYAEFEVERGRLIPVPEGAPSLH
jgi:PD-(D/E)XK endonuclease